MALVKQAEIGSFYLFEIQNPGHKTLQRDTRSPTVLVPNNKNASCTSEPGYPASRVDSIPDNQGDVKTAGIARTLARLLTLNFSIFSRTNSLILCPCCGARQLHNLIGHAA